MIEKVLIVVKKNGREALDLARQIMEYLDSKGVRTYCDVVTARDMNLTGVDPGEATADLVLVLGGDGTLLWAESKISGKGIPILGINFGTMGFLTELSPDEWREALDRVLNGRYTVEERSKIDVAINNRLVGTALNEVVVKTAVPVEMLSLGVSVDEQEVETLMADGIIVSTPTGSTAYSLSVGGPIVDKRVQTFIITSISPFKLGARPVVVPDTSQIKITLKGEKRGVVVIDGESRTEVTKGGEIRCTLSNHKAHLVKLDEDFYGRIQRRLRR